MKKVLVFDFGASSGRAMLCGFDGKSVISEEIHRFANNPIEKGNSLCWDISALFSEVETAIKKADKLGFDAISIDTWGVDFGLIDRNGKLMGNPVHYRDIRTENIPQKVYEIIGENELYKRNGIQSMRINTIFQLYSLKLNGGLENADKMLMMPDLFSWYLTGNFFNEYTMATTSQLFNSKKCDWDYELIDMLGLPRRLFSKIIMPGEVYGILDKKFIGRKVPVIAAPSHDTASAIVAVPSTDKDFIFVSCGTWTLFGTELTEAICTTEARNAGLTNEGGTGGTITFLKNIMGLWLIQETRRYYLKNLDESWSFAKMEKEAANAEFIGSYIDPNDDMFSMPGDMPLKIKEYLRKTGQAVPTDEGQLIRIIYESLSKVFAETFTDISIQTGKTYNRIYMFGGGSRDSLLCSLTAKKTGKKVIAGPFEATATGNAVSALVWLGEIENVNAARGFIRSSDDIREYNP